MRTIVTDYFTGEKVAVENTKTFIRNGDIKKSAVDVNDLHLYNTCNDLKCTFGAQTSINFQYSFVVALTSHTEMYKKDCKKDGKVISTIETEINAVNKLYSLASYGFMVTKLYNGNYSLISPRYSKLTAIRRIVDGFENFLDIQYVACTQYDKDVVLDNVVVNHADIIKEVQKTDRHFKFKWVSDRINKKWN